MFWVEAFSTLCRIQFATWFPRPALALASDNPPGFWPGSAVAITYSHLLVGMQQRADDADGGSKQGGKEGRKEEGDKFPASSLIPSAPPQRPPSVRRRPRRPPLPPPASCRHCCAAIEPNFDRGWKIAGGIIANSILSLLFRLVFAVGKFS